MPCLANSFSLAVGRTPINSTRRKQLRSKRECQVLCSAGNSDDRRILVLGGTGRVGSSTAAAIKNLEGSFELLLAGRTKDKFEATVERRPTLKGSKFAQCDINDVRELEKAMEGVDLVVHAAGPFQRKEDTKVLDKCIELGVPYLDVCDDAAYSERVKAKHADALEAGVPAITTAGIYPGISNLMAAHMISTARGEYGEDGKLLPKADAAGAAVSPSRVLYSYFTAGSGGVGPTILETSFLLAGEEVTAYKDGKAVTVPPVSGWRSVDFGPGIGRRSVYLYNLPEVGSTHRCLGVPSVSARFGTDPEFWNWAMVLLARAVPRGVLNNREAVARIAKLADPLVRAVDKYVGEKVSMRVEVDFSNGKNVCGVFTHKYLSESVGTSTAAFVDAMLTGQTQPGVWFPEEPEALQDRQRALDIASQGCFLFALNKPFWQIEGEPVQLGMGMYL
uniref:Saccharopine dehydrogenase-like protein n=1 Tax=Tetraselmis sp. GSL018 TaxID=582737 RepID=A0A061SB72_9CHLO